MDAVALPIVAGPTPMPTPSSEVPLSEPPPSFGVLVAAVAKGEDSQAAGTSEAPSNDAMPSSGATSDVPPSFVVRQWLAQTHSPHSLSKGLISVLERVSGVRPEQTASLAAPEDLPSNDDTDAAALANRETAQPEPEGLLSSNDGDTTASPIHAMGSKSHSAKMPEGTDTPATNHSSAKLRVEPSDALILPFLATPSENPQLAQQQQTGGSGSSALDATDGSTSAPRQHFTPPPAISPPVAAERPDSTKPSAEPSTDEPIAAADHAKTTHTADSTKPGEPNSASPKSARATEQPQPLATPTQGNSSTTASHETPDSLNAAPPAMNVSSAGEDSGEAPVKLALATRTGQQTPEMQSLALHIAARSARGDSRFTIRLDPPELGRIDVNLSVSSHGHAQAVLAVEKPQTLELLLRDAPTLERALKDAGLELGSNLSFSLKEDGRSQFARDDQHTRPTRPVQLVQAEAANIRSPLHSSAIEHLYGLRIARLDITV